MNRQSNGKRAQLMLAAIGLLSVLMMLVLTSVAGADSGEWLEVIVGFGMLLAVGLGGWWFAQYQLKFR